MHYTAIKGQGLISCLFDGSLYLKGNFSNSILANTQVSINFLQGATNCDGRRKEESASIVGLVWFKLDVGHMPRLYLSKHLAYMKSLSLVLNMYSILCKLRASPSTPAEAFGILTLHVHWIATSFQQDSGNRELLGKDILCFWWASGSNYLGQHSILQWWQEMMGIILKFILCAKLPSRGLQNECQMLINRTQ